MTVRIPQTLDEALTEAIAAVQRALEDGQRRLMVELVVPEIALQAQTLAWEFSQIFLEEGLGLRVIFPDTGAAALAKRDWGEIPFQVSDLGSRYTPIDAKISDTDSLFLVVSPSAVEVQSVERLCELAGDRPVILLIPQLEDVSIVGIGYAARQLRERFLSTLFSAFYFRPLDGAWVIRSYPSQWEVYQEQGDDQPPLAIATLPEKPVGEALEQLLMGADGPEQTNSLTPPKRGNFLTGLNRFLKALSQ